MEDYTNIASILKCDPKHIKLLQIDTIKEMLYNVSNATPPTNTLSMKHINSLGELDCVEYNQLYNPTFNPLEFKVFNVSAKSKLAFSLLNGEQQRIVYYIFEKISCAFNVSGLLVDPTVILLDAPSGTGKSFLIDCLGLCIRDISMLVMAKTHALLENISTIKDSDMIQSMTTCKFIMTYFDLPYAEAIHKFKNVYNSMEEVSEVVDTLLSTCKSWMFNLLIIDEYSMESPLLLLVLLIIAKRQNVNVLIMGDIKQQNTLSCSRFHLDTNYNLINILPGIHNYQLLEQMRIKDAQLLDLINGIKAFIGDNEGNVNNTFKLKYYIFTTLRQRFFQKADLLNDVYLTDTHKHIKAREAQLHAYVKTHNIQHKVQPFERLNRITGKSATLVLPADGKYLPHLLLIEGAQYLHERKFVTLVKIHLNHVEVRDQQTKATFYINKMAWTPQYHECVDDNFKWLTGHVEDYCDNVYTIVQYPLRLTLLTFYYIQGLTFNTQKISVNIDCMLANSLYVGFSRVTELAQIHEIKTKDLLGLLYTQYKNDGYLYKLIKPSPDFVDHLQKYHADRFYTFDDTQYKFRELPAYIFERASNNLVYIKTLKQHNLKRPASISNVNKKLKREPTDLSNLLKTYYGAEA